METREATYTIERGTLAGWESRTLVSSDGATRATLVPDLAMLTWSLSVDGQEYLGHPNSVQDFARGWATTGIPLLHPWANRLGGDRLLGTAVPTIVRSPLIPRDARGLPIHGINLAGAGWQLSTEAVDAEQASLAASLDFTDPARLALFPFPHRLTISATLRDRTLTITTSVTATGTADVPVAFGWHPYFQIPGTPRDDWKVGLPAGRRVELDAAMLPTDRSAPYVRASAPLGRDTFDDLFGAFATPPVFTLAGGGHTLDVALGTGYGWAQVYAPPGQPLIAFEPMTAPGNAVVTGRGLRWLSPGDMFSAAFSVRVTSTAR